MPATKYLTRNPAEEARRKEKEGVNKPSSLANSDAAIQARNAAVGFDPQGGKFLGNQPYVSEEQKAMAQEKLQQAGAFEEVTPKVTDLSSEFQPQTPVLGPAMGALAKVLPKTKKAAEKSRQNALEQGKPLLRETGLEAFPTYADQTAREQALNEISRKAYDEGLSKGERFGSVIEAIPGIGGLIGKYVGGLVEAPYGNAKNVRENIIGYREEATNLIEKTNKHYIPPVQALQRAQDMENDVAQLKGRLKLLISSSAVLRANSDEVNKIQAEIYRTEEMIQALRQAASQAYTAQLTGTYQTPTDEQIYTELAGYNNQD